MPWMHWNLILYLSQQHCVLSPFYGKRIASHSRYCDVEQVCKARWHSCFFLFDVHILFDLVWTFVRGWDMVCFRQLYTSIHLTMTMWWVPWLHIRWDHWGEQLFCTCCLKHWFLIFYLFFLFFSYFTTSVVFGWKNAKKEETNVAVLYTFLTFQEPQFVLMLWFLLPLVVIRHKYLLIDGRIENLGKKWNLLT